MKHRALFIALTSTFALTAGCVSSPKQRPAEAQLPPAEADGNYRVAFPEAKQGEERLIAVIGPKLEVLCDFDPHFGYASSEPLPQDAERLKALAGCLNREAVRARSVLLVGHADVRGSDAFNRDLAWQRARRVKQLLVEHGVAPERLRIASAGERGAKGFTPGYAHGYDRRVDVVLSPESSRAEVSTAR